MTDRSQPHQVQVHPQLRYDPGYKGQQGSFSSKVLAPSSCSGCFCPWACSGGGSSFWGIWADGADIAVVGVAVPRQVTQAIPEQLDQAKKRMQDMAGYGGQKTKEVGQEIQKKGA
ncbi:hypothetical protein GH714_009901 [Hevea brasiliensis]|uniref:Uncharacterized protein n=1 Tax=Hevea brasiliensis TaxID=3981 RepID=A0A6A6M465_HEVBR|nr:hypothetical protein GH714_009901 [Hevea brasiliensis]